MAVFYRTIDRCKDPACRCDDTYGVVIYDGQSLSEAEAAALNLARYDEPEIEVIDR